MKPYALYARLLAGLILLTLFGAACSGGGGGSSSADDPEESPESTAALEATPLTFAERPEMMLDLSKVYYADIEMESGAFRIKLRPDIAPETVNSFVFLAREGFYNGVTFHRVLPGFVAQAGDPTGTGNGGPGYTLPLEPGDVPFTRGTVGLARSNDRNSGGSQFFVLLGDAEHLNGAYTLFGGVLEGMEVVDAITARNPDPAVNPTPPPPGDKIVSITIVEE